MPYIRMARMQIVESCLALLFRPLSIYIMKTDAVKSKNNAVKMKELFLKLQYGTHLTVILAIFSKKDSKYA